MDYLDLNSLLFGVVPAMHALPSVTAALTSNTYGRRVLLSRYGAWNDAALWSAELLSKWQTEGFEQQRQEAAKWYEISDSDGREEIDKQRVLLDAAESRAAGREVHWAAVYDLQGRVNKYLVGVMQQKAEAVLPQMQGQSLAVSHSHAPAGAPGTVRPVYFTAPDAALELLLCVPPFHPVPSSARGNYLTMDTACSLDESNCDSWSPHRVDFAGFMQWNGISDGYSLWSLYMGPVYVYDNEHTAGMGYEVDIAQLSSLTDQWGKHLYPAASTMKKGKTQQKQRAIRQLFISDPNHLPVTQRMPFGCTQDIHMFAPTLAACFRAKGVTALIETTRAKWAAIVEKHTAAARATAENSDAEEEEDEEEESRADDEEEYDEEEDDDTTAMSDRDGATLEYEEGLMSALFAPMHEAMWKQPLWTDEVAKMTAAILASSF